MRPDCDACRTTSSCDIAKVSGVQQCSLYHVCASAALLQWCSTDFTTEDHQRRSRERELILMPECCFMLSVPGRARGAYNMTVNSYSTQAEYGTCFEDAAVQTWGSGVVHQGPMGSLKSQYKVGLSSNRF